jgi:hypothetical protein
LRRSRQGQPLAYAQHCTEYCETARIVADDPSPDKNGDPSPDKNENPNPAKNNDGEPAEYPKGLTKS